MRVAVAEVPRCLAAAAVVRASDISSLWWWSSVIRHPPNIKNTTNGWVILRGFSSTNQFCFFVILLRSRWLLNLGWWYVGCESFLKFYSTSNGQRRRTSVFYWYKDFYRVLCGARCRFPSGHAKIQAFNDDFYFYLDFYFSIAYCLNGLLSVSIGKFKS
jgi:hypothetical protein